MTRLFRWVDFIKLFAPMAVQFVVAKGNKIFQSQSGYSLWDTATVYCG